MILFQCLHDKVKDLAKLVNSKEKCPRIYGRQSSRANAPALTTSEYYYKRNLVIPFVDIQFRVNCVPLWRKQTCAHFELCSLMPNVISK